MDRRFIGIKCLLGRYKCQSCNKDNYFSEKIPNEKVTNFECPHFKLIVMFINSNGLKFHLKTYCNHCYKEYSSVLKLGGLDANHQLITDDNYISFCCGNKIEVSLNLAKDFIDTNDRNSNNVALINNNNNRNNNNNNNNFNNFNNYKNNFFNFYPMMNNGMNMNMMNQNMNFFNQRSLMMNMNNNSNFINFFINQKNNNNFNNNINFNNNNNNNNNFNNNINNNMNFKYNNISNIKFDSSNIMEFGKKKKLITFLDESTNKKYKIYTSPHLKIKNVLSDLLNQFPEINYNNNIIALNGNNINIESSISSCNLNENSIIILKK